MESAVLKSTQQENDQVLTDYSVNQQESTQTKLVLNLNWNKRKPLKLTNPKKIALFQSLIKEFNVAKACRTIGISRKLFDKYCENNEIFRNQVNEIKGIWLDKHESAMFEVGSTASREGFQDRKLALQSYRRDIYGDKLQVNQKHELKVEITIGELNRILDGTGVNRLNAGKTNSLPDSDIQDAEFTELPR